MKLFYLILLGALCALPMKANSDIPTGLDEINCPEENNPRYFNLQGIEVVNPVKGQILIEKKGETVHKQ